MTKNQTTVNGKMRFSINGGVRISTTRKGRDEKYSTDTEDIEFDNLSVEIEFDNVRELKEMLTTVASTMIGGKESKQLQPRKREAVSLEDDGELY